MNRSVLKLVFLLGILLVVNPGQAQTNGYSLEQEKQFISYLIGTKQYREALFLIKRYTDTSTNSSLNDTLFFLKSKIYYNRQLLLESNESINLVSTNFIHYNALKVLESYQWAHLGEIEKSSKLLESLSPETNLGKELINFEKASINLLSHNMEAYANYKKNQDTSFYQLTEAQFKLHKFATQMEGFNNKSPLMAGVMSAILPGSGKMYVGKIGEGVSTLLGMAILGAITYENYRKEGISNYKTITFGSLFAVFYAGNIFGSVYSVKVYREEFNKNMNHAVLFNMHIPIRNIYPDIFK